MTSKGFTVTTSGTDTLRGELQAIAYDFNNNTNIRCRASTDDPFVILLSNTAVLIIQGLYACMCMPPWHAVSACLLNSYRSIK